jgi:hypothetical protein
MNYDISLTDFKVMMLFIEKNKEAALKGEMNPLSAACKLLF